MNAFHLSLPVREYAATRTFYCDLLGGQFDRDEETGFTVDLHGHQITFRDAPEKVPDTDSFHFGLNVRWSFFHSLFEKLREQGVRFEWLPEYENMGQPNERVKMIFRDPNGYLLEFKAYRNPND